MKVVISGYYGYHNIGDEAILKSIITSLKKESPNIEIVVLSNDINHTQNTCNVRAINRWNIIEIYKELKTSNLLISGGGSLLQDATSNRTIKYYVGIMMLAKLASKPIFVYAQGIGPINNKLNQHMTKYIMNKANQITLRDEESKQLLEQFGVTNDIKLVPDPVMGYDIGKFKSQKCEIYDKDYITISVRDWNESSIDLYKKIAYTSDALINKGYQVVFIPMHGKRDYEASQKVCEIMNNKASIFPYDSTIEEKIYCIKKSKLIIGMRLHALIFAANVNTPMIGISYDPKIDSFLKLVNQKCIGKVDGNWESDELSNQALKILDNYIYYSKELSKESEKLKKHTQNTANMVINNIKSRG